MNNKKSRIAFCFSGQARTLDQTYIFFQKNLFDAAKEQGFDYDVFCAVEDDEDVDKVNLLNPTKIEKIKSNEVEKMICKQYGKLIKQDIKNNVWRDFDVNRFLQQIYKVSKSIELMQSGYDIVFRLRFDVLFFNKLNFKTIYDEIKDGKSIICNYHFLTGSRILGFDIAKQREIGDFYFIGSSNSINNLKFIYSSFEKNIGYFKVKKGKIFLRVLLGIMNSIKLLNKKIGHWIFPVLPIFLIASKFYKVFNPEIFYYHFFLNKNLTVKKVKMSYILIRKDIEKSLIMLEKKTKYEL